ncbi:2,3,4,5-tetrahydropyridine-2,6-carboxylate N-succinyltransferase [Caminibacter pacificus]|uniref:2,3,4,5-tetrahydropyridine-2,6-carboxylate N-succinyltransferase n=1 Tax=Caminibacter pacificus TaxID=1424653 RepID=A0AAJ4RDE2_9BACT|nr:2,3,4,5-tetrahydropyridine-2,6-carboxylate N-succinyltransferase [Caminibacter pacificus]NPA87083.1 2,3,4,5-tetrahydropyridine-2,6-carboxylate N-succinyltransferase [Campylobacterota bacterium]QCI27555.1 2,3,4,5-tetrahydropyridine-2,6-carboxylate N-succinyltransferase [Caminibacter pacificus]ROR40267.1 2,3,4,5-tetrahydropyridine-2-carboxylate N-succinyltransferase [Caminibacter pacificus]
MFEKLVESIDKYKKPLAFGIARVDLGQLNHDKVLQATYPVINWNENFGSAAVFIRSLIETGVEVDFEDSEFVAPVTKEFVDTALNYFGEELVAEAVGDKHKNIQVLKVLKDIFDEEEYDNYRICFIFEDTNPKSVESVYLKLYALSQRKVPLRSINLNGAFGVLHNCAWVGNVPIELDYLRANEIELKLKDAYPEVEYVDKFPRFLSHVIPDDNIRILDSSKVRFGAQLAPGTTVMPGASYINFNAGTEGPVMVEGRISSSAVVKEGADVGGGASILGVLSGTNGNPITIGRNTLLGANSVTGIPLGDGCIVDAGIAVLEGTKIWISEDEFEKIKEVNPEWNAEYKEYFKGLELAGLNGIHYRFDTTKGKMVAFRSRREVKLNEELH